jgi:hypothetical protein
LILNRQGVIRANYNLHKALCASGDMSEVKQNDILDQKNLWEVATTNLSPSFNLFELLSTQSKLDIASHKST